jgi:hypothetical protein
MESRMRHLAFALSLLLPALGACYDDFVNVTLLPAPANLTYQVEPSGDPATPSGILLRWDALDSRDLEAYRVYSRPSSTSSFGLRGTTTSTTFHDNGYPALDYYVTAVSLDGGESAASNTITVDERLALARPAALTSISLNGAIHLEWTDNAYQSNPSAFGFYRVYSAGYSLDSNLCGTRWSLEGTTVSSSFLSGNLTNGVPRCFAVSAVSIEGYESVWSPLRNDTPRPDGRNVLLTALDADPTKAAFRFWLDANANRAVDPGELGVVLNGGSASADFQVLRNANGIFLQPVRSGATVRTYGTVSVSDLTSIDLAPVGGYGRTAVQAVPGFGYVFQINEGDGFYRYGALRVTAVGSDYIIVDWAYQTDPGNPELVRAVR